MNKDDEKLNNSTLKEEDQKYILVIGGIGIFLPGSQAEASMCVASATTEKGQPMQTVIEEEIEQKLTSAQMEKDEEHSS
jgi:hypothetical protein